VFVGWNNGYRNAPEGEILGINSVGRVRNLNPDEVFEIVDRVARGNLDRERVRGSLSINKAEQSERVVGQGVAKH
jgi:hypothetical protein